jgi:hypothetical protein
MLVLQFTQVVPCLRGLYWWSTCLPLISLVCMPLPAQASLDEYRAASSTVLWHCVPHPLVVSGVCSVCHSCVTGAQLPLCTVQSCCRVDARGTGSAKPAYTVSLCMCIYMCVHRLALTISFTKQQHTPCCRDQLGGCTVDALVHQVCSFDCCMARVQEKRHAWRRMFMRKHCMHAVVRYLQETPAAEDV